MSNDTSIVTVDNNGNITALRKGTTTITITVDDTVLTLNVTVNNDPTLNISKKTIYAGNSFNLKVVKGLNGKATFKSSNKKVATVNSKGKITGRKKGTCTIIIRTNGVTLKRRITVINPRLNKMSIKLVQGKTFKLKVYGGNGKVKYSSNNKRIATVSKYGNIKAKYAGSCKITVLEMVLN